MSNRFAGSDAGPPGLGQTGAGDHGKHLGGEVERKDRSGEQNVHASLLSGRLALEAIGGAVAVAKATDRPAVGALDGLPKAKVATC